MMLQLFRRVSARLHIAASRSYTAPSAQHSIYISNSTNPYFNLTFEDWLFRHKNSEEPLLLIYRDDPCVIIGRNQNPWKEVNFEALHARPGIPFIRRRSGGGTVYHDLGNTNFSIHLPRQAFDRHVTAQVVLRAVRSLDIDARINERNDICVGPDKMSRSAYKIVNKRAYHHGTMLISSQLDILGDLLRTNKDTMVTKGVASVRSPVCNLQRFSDAISHDNFMNAVVHEFQKEYGLQSSPQMIDQTEDLEILDYIRKGMDELRASLLSWDWAYGQTPEFTYMIENSFKWGNMMVEIRSKHGIINSCAFNLMNTSLDETIVEEITGLGRSLEGTRYGFWDSNLAVSGPLQDVFVWMQKMLGT
ncbi:Lipoate-protein ligase A [Hypsizygus marmoreus]|uniref:Putative lipoate-protein ligase A n=1 Tax=Hypsizygus marmoreus TaxID=39966 RepID=A0A369JDF7_HYPMA|nr:Lipoate-protein ligase A [Hypsizygus marmoreus]